jgi:hypothetical protein
MFCASLFLTAACRPQEISITPATLASITIRPATQSIAPGTTVQLQAFGIYTNNTEQNLTTFVVWSSTNPDIATVDSKGLVTAKSIGSTASATIMATFQNIIGTMALTTSPPESIALAPSAPTIASGTSVQFSAMGTLLNGATQDLTSYVTWSSSDTGIAAISTSGLATTTTSTTGSTTITASFDTVTGTTTLTSAAVSFISVSPSSATIVFGTTEQFDALGTLAGGVSQDLTAYALWSSSSPTVAIISNATGSRGLVVSLGTGTTQITASFGGVSSNPATLTVTPAVLKSISVTPSGASIPIGAKQQFTATGTYSNGMTKDITASATWTSTNTQVATVSDAIGTKGLATAAGIGTTTVIATFSGVTSNAVTLTVSPAALTSITVTPSNPTIALGSVVGLQFKALGTFSDGTAQDLTATVAWTSSNIAVAFISTAPGSQGFATAVGVGTTTITATSGSVLGSTVLTVTF